MPDYPHDPDFPYVVVWGDFGAARFSTRENADEYAKQSAGRVIDTTPAPLPTKFGAIVKSAGIRHILVDPRDTGYEWRTEAGAGFSRTEELQAKGFEVLFEGLDGD